MEIKTRLKKTYTEEQRCHFIVEQNHNKGYEIRETEQELQAWGYTQEEKQEQEVERVANLKMTALDFIGVLKGLGLTAEQIRDYLNDNADLDLQLKCCDRVYCGVVQALCPLNVYGHEITKDMVIQAFKAKNGKNDEN